MSPQPASGRATVSRRVLLAGVLGGVVTTASCGVTLEQDAPSIPLLPTPTREPVADEDLLVAAWRDTEQLARTAAAVAGDQRQLAHRLAALHRQQHRALDRMLRRAGVPLHAGSTPPIGAIPHTGGRSGTTSSASTPPTAAELARLEARAVTRQALARLGAATAAGITTLACLAAQRAAAAALLAAAPRWHDANQLPSDAAARLLKATRPAVYAFQVVAARSGHGLRRRARHTLDRLQVQERALEALAGRAAPPPPLGYELPGPARSGSDLRLLARDALAPLLPANAALLAAAAGQPDVVSTLVRLLAQDTTWATRWGVPSAPFPGLTAPSLTS